jgi:ubiquinone/menaquinone biosynthesis C-methylase UbiE
MKKAIERHWSRDANNYNKSIKTTLKSVEAKRHWQEIFADALGKDRLKILDAGTGPGIVAFLLAELGHDVTGVDFSEGMLRNALKNKESLGLPVDFRIGDAEKLPFDDNAFDAVVSRYVLWTVADPLKAMLEWKRVLKPGGKVVIVDGNWHHGENTIKRRAWHTLSLILIAITERKNPLTHEFSAELKKDLWSLKVERPDADRKFLEQSGFRKIRLKEGISTRTQTALEYLKSGYMEDAFLISAIK